MSIELSPVERKVVAAAKRGDLADLAPGGGVQKGDWESLPPIRASVIEALCCADTWPVHAKGCRIRGARIDGALDFEDSTLLRPLHLVNCWIGERMNLERSRVKALVLTGSRCRGIDAAALSSEASLMLDSGFSAHGLVDLAGATIAGDLDCDGGRFKNPHGDALTADRLECKGDARLGDGFVAKGEVRLLAATIGGDLHCRAGTFENPDADALSADKVQCGGSIYLDRGFKSRGEVRLIGCSARGDLNCRAGEFENPGQHALQAARLECRGSLFLAGGFRAAGEVRLVGVTIGGNLECGGGRFESPNGEALALDRLRCEGDVLLADGFTAEGEVRLPSARVGGDLLLRWGVIENPEGDALSADRIDCRGRVSGVGVVMKGRARLVGATVQGDLDLQGAALENLGASTLLGDKLTCGGDVGLKNGFVSKGEVRFLGAKIAGDLDCTGARFENPGGDALSLDSAHCDGSLYLGEAFEALGVVRLIGVALGGDLDCAGGRFESPGDGAITADRFACHGGLFLRQGFHAVGEVSFAGSRVGDGLLCKGGRFENPGGVALSLTGATIEKRLELTHLLPRPKGRIELGGATAGSFFDDRASWSDPEDGEGRTHTLGLEGFRYDHIEPMELKMRLKWLERSAFAPQAYEQLADVLRRNGREEDGTAVLMAKHRARLGSDTESRWTKLRLRVLGATIGYGYRPRRAVWGLLALWLLGSWIFAWSADEKIMAPVNTQLTTTEHWRLNRSVPPEFQDFPAWSPVLYSLDALIPVVSLHMEEYWEPSLARDGPVLWIVPLSRVTWVYLRLHILLGWILTTLAVLGFTGLVRLK